MGAFANGAGVAARALKLPVPLADALQTRELQNFSLELLESKETGGEHLLQARTFVTQSFIVLQIHYEMFSECSYKMIKKNLVWDDGAVKNVRY